MKKTMKIAAALVLVCAFAHGVSAQTAEEVKAGVVKIRASGGITPRDGTGFIVRADEDVVLIITAAHVIEGAGQVSVTFYTRKDVPVLAEVDCTQFDNPQGIATLKIVGKNKIPSGLVALELDTANMLKGGEDVTTVCFPGRTGLWSVIKGSIVRTEGTGYVLSVDAEEGCSGAPVMNGQKAIGVIMAAEKLRVAVRSKVVEETLAGWGVSGFDRTRPERSATKQDDEVQIREVVIKSQLFETLTIYAKPRDFDRSMLDKYWVPVSKGGHAIQKVEATIQRLLTRGLRYGPESERRRFYITNIRISGDVAYVNTVEQWYCVLYKENGERVWERDPDLGLANVEYTLRKIDGQWLIQYNSTAYAH